MSPSTEDFRLDVATPSIPDESEWHGQGLNVTRSPASCGSTWSGIPEDRCQTEEDSNDDETNVTDEEHLECRSNPFPESKVPLKGSLSDTPRDSCHPGSRLGQRARLNRDSIPAIIDRHQQHWVKDSFVPPSSDYDPLQDVLNWMSFAASNDEQHASADFGGQKQVADNSSTGHGLRRRANVVVEGREKTRPGGRSPFKEGTDSPDYAPSDDDDARPQPPPSSSQLVRMRSFTSETPSSAIGSPAVQKANSMPLLRLLPETPKKHNLTVLGCSQAPEEDVDKEEDEWVGRKKLTGTVCRMAFYRAGGVDPSGDILGLRRTKTGRLKVSSLKEGGIAAASGVEVGDQLVSINGVEPCSSLMAEAVRMRLRAPAVVIFMGFVGKLQAEVRVRQLDSTTCGFPNHTDVASALLNDQMTSDLNLVVCDPVVFQQSPTSLFLAVPTRQRESAQSIEDAAPCFQLAALGSTETAWRSAHNAVNGTGPGTGPGAAEILAGLAGKEAMSSCGPDECARVQGSAPGHSRVYELQRQDARRLVTRALRHKSAGV